MEQLFIPEKYRTLCLQHAEKITRTRNLHQSDFWSSEQRSEQKFVGDILGGKLAEFAFALFVWKRIGWVIKPDLSIYANPHDNDGFQDIQEIEINGVAWPNPVLMDIKKVPVSGKWAMVVDRKLKADVYITIKLDDNMATICGYAGPQDYEIIRHRGERLFNPDDPGVDIGPPLKAEINHCIPIRDLRQDWDGFFARWKERIFNERTPRNQSSRAGISKGIRHR